MARSTVDVLWLLEYTNGLLSLPNVTVEEKIGASRTLEAVLMKTGNYFGYMYSNLTDTHRCCRVGDLCTDGTPWTAQDEQTRMYLYSPMMRKQMPKFDNATV